MNRAAVSRRRPPLRLRRVVPRRAARRRTCCGAAIPTTTAQRRRCCCARWATATCSSARSCCAPASATTAAPPAGSSPAPAPTPPTSSAAIANHDRLAGRGRAPMGLGGAAAGIAVGLLGARRLREPGVLAAPHLQHLAPADRARAVTPAEPERRETTEGVLARRLALLGREPARRLDRRRGRGRAARPALLSEDAALHLRRERRVAELLLGLLADLEGAERLDLVLGRAVPDRVGPPQDALGPDGEQQLAEHVRGLVGVGQRRSATSSRARRRRSCPGPIPASRQRLDEAGRRRPPRRTAPSETARSPSGTRRR